MQSHDIFLRFTLILPYHLNISLLSCLLVSDFLTKTMYPFPLTTRVSLPSVYPWVYLSNNIQWNEKKN